MRNRFLPRRVFSVALVLASIVLAVVLLDRSPLSVVLGSGLFDSQLVTPTPTRSVQLLPTSTPEPVLSEAAQQALAYIAQREGIPVEALVIVADHPTEYPALGREFQVLTLLDVRPEGQPWKLLVDLTDGRMEEDISALLVAEARAHQTR